MGYWRFHALRKELSKTAFVVLYYSSGGAVLLDEDRSAHDAASLFFWRQFDNQEWTLQQRHGN